MCSVPRVLLIIQSLLRQYQHSIRRRSSGCSGLKRGLRCSGPARKRPGSYASIQTENA